MPAATDTGSDQRFTWSRSSTRESYFELDSDTGLSASFGDGFPIGNDGVAADLGSPSQPDTAITFTDLSRGGDDPFIDVDITPPAP